MKAMNDSFDYGTAILNEQTDATMAGTIQGPPWMGPSTRARMFAFPSATRRTRTGRWSCISG